jgi:sterol desaturase/sphingolipid hydroxylase (fatty acid hydroxylase superfamily)
VLAVTPTACPFTDALLRFLSEWSAGLMALWFAALFLAERVRRAFAPAPGGRRRWLSSAVFLVLNRSLVSSLFSLPLLVWATRLRFWSWPDGVPPWALVVAAVLLLDLAGYWVHRALHYCDFLWRFHQVHHLDETLDVATGLRVHFGEVLLSTGVAAALVVVCDLPALGVVLYALLSFAAATFQHSNVRVPVWLERAVAPVLNTPAFHHPHHHAEKRDTNSNYGLLFPWWDRLFGTHNARRRTDDWRMGLEYSPDLDCLGLLCEPFRPTPLWARGRCPEPRGTDEPVPLGSRDLPSADLVPSRS